MKKLLVGLVVLLVLAVGGVLVAPSIVDWNAYKPQITDRIFQLTGRRVTISGDISARLLPQPVITAEDIAVLNPDDLPEGTLLEVDSAVARVAFWPLLGGLVQVETVRLLDPQLILENHGEDRNNWAPSASSATQAVPPTDDATAQAAGDAQAGPFALQIDSFVIDNGSLLYRDLVTTKTYQLGGIQARLAAGSIMGPYDATGTLIYQGLPVNFELSIGKIIHGRTVSFATNGNLDGEAGKAAFTGTLSNTNTGPVLRGSLQVGTPSLATLIGKLSGGGTYSGMLDVPLQLQGELNAAETGLTLADLKGTLDDTPLTGTFSVALGEAPDIRAQLAVTRLNLDRWLSRPPVQVSAPSVSATQQDSGGSGAAVSLDLSSATRQQDGMAGMAAAVPLTLPPGLAVALGIAVDVVDYRGEMLRQVKVEGGLRQQDLVISQVSVQLPDGGDLLASASLASESQEPRLTGGFQANVVDSHRLLNWLGIEIPPVASGRLRRLTAKGAVSATTKLLEISKLEATFDNSKLVGGIAINLTNRLSFGANLVLDQIDIDAYMPAASAPRADSSVTPADNQDSTTEQASADPGLRKLIDGLANVDANIMARVDNAFFRSVPLRDVRLDATLFSGNLDLRQLSVGDAAGTNATLVAKIKGLSNKGGGEFPEIEQLSLDGNTKNLDKLLPVLGITPPDNITWGEGSLTAKAQGSLLTPTLEVSAELLGGTVQIAGDFSPLDLLTGIKTAVTVEHPSWADLASRLGYSVRSAKPIKLSALMVKQADTLALTNLSGLLAGTSVSGDITNSSGRERPQWSANLLLGKLDLDALLPNDKGGSRDNASKRKSGKNAPRWSTDPLDMSALESADVNLSINIQSLDYGGYTLDNALFKGATKDGVFTLDSLNGEFFGGRLEAQGRLTPNAAPALSGHLAINDANLAPVLSAMAGKAAALGLLNVEADLSATGTSEAQLVSSLAGSGQIGLANVELRQNPVGGTAAAALVDLLSSLYKLSSITSDKGGLANLTGTFKAARGIISSDDLYLISAAGNGKATATINLPKWHIKAEGEVETASSAIGALVAEAAKLPRQVPFTIEGALDSPKVTLKTIALPGMGDAPKQIPTKESPVTPQQKDQSQLDKLKEQLRLLQQQKQQQEDGAKQENSPPPPSGDGKDLFQRLLDGALKKS